MQMLPPLRHWLSKLPPPPFSTKSFSNDSLWQISTRIHTIVSLKIHEHSSLPGLTSLRHSSPLYSPLFTSVPSSFSLSSSFSSVLPLPSFPIAKQDSSPSPFLLWVAADWLTMPLQVNVGNEAKGRVCSDPKRQGQFTLQAGFGYVHICLRTDNIKNHSNNHQITKTFAIKIYMPFKIMFVSRV